MCAKKIFGLAVVALAVTFQKGAFAIPEGGPIELCEYEEQLLADRYSCTRYHVCRRLQFSDQFGTDIAICSPEKVFDMVSSECVDYETGFLQDPAACTTFYGCHPTKETSEGFLRRNYTCPGDLRFNPEKKFCTFKTSVTDDLCNSRDKAQRIIGRRESSSEDQDDNFNVAVRSNNYATEYSSPTYHSPPPTLPQQVYLTNPSLVTSNISPWPITSSHNLSRIAQAITDELISLEETTGKASSDQGMD